MKVIHSDGRTGTVDDKFRGEVAVSWDRIEHIDPGEAWYPSRDLRPLGPIEDQLRNERTICKWDTDTFELWVGADKELRRRSPGVCRFNVEDIDSEAIEACERIFEQHGVSL